MGRARSLEGDRPGASAHPPHGLGGGGDTLREEAIPPPPPLAPNPRRAGEPIPPSPGGQRVTKQRMKGKRSIPRESPRATNRWRAKAGTNPRANGFTFHLNREEGGCPLPNPQPRPFVNGRGADAPPGQSRRPDFCFAGGPRGRQMRAFSAVQSNIWFQKPPPASPRRREGEL